MADALRDGDRVTATAATSSRSPGSERRIREVTDRIRTAVARPAELRVVVTINAGAALHPDARPRKDGVVAVARTTLYLPSLPGHMRLGVDDPTRDPYLAAIDQMALRLLGASNPQLLRGSWTARRASSA
jgi:hypothetical protein